MLSFPTPPEPSRSAGSFGCEAEEFSILAALGLSYEGFFGLGEEKAPYGSLQASEGFMVLKFNFNTSLGLKTIRRPPKLRPSKAS